MKRRQFLRGLAGVAGAAALPLPLQLTLPLPEPEPALPPGFQYVYFKITVSYPDPDVKSYEQILQALQYEFDRARLQHGQQLQRFLAVPVTEDQIF